MSKPIIGITTDIDSEYLKIKYHYSAAILNAGGIPILIPPSEIPVLYADMIDGLIIPGGNDLDPFYYHEEATSETILVSRERSDFEFSLLKEVMNLRKPVLGICYGMQLINVAFGGSLYQDIDTQLSVAITHKKGYHLIVTTGNRLFREDTFSVNSTHHQGVKKLGKGISAFAYSPDNLIEAFIMDGYPFLAGIQWHPERIPESEFSRNLFESFVKAAYDCK